MTDSFQSAASHGLFLDDAIASDAAPAPELPSMIARPDGILVWANITWCGMCGFTAKEDAMGRDLKCIQGPGTDRAELKVGPAHSCARICHSLAGLVLPPTTIPRADLRAAPLPRSA